MEEIDFLDCLYLATSLYDEIERKIANLFNRLNIREYPIDPMKIAESLGYELIPFSKMNNEAKKMLISKDSDGISFYNPIIKKYVIYYNSDSTKERLRFTIGHEIGHIQMGHKCESDLARRIANYYAAYLLAPTPWIKCASCEDYTDVAKNFIVSEQCALICFNRYRNWNNFSNRKNYEITLINLLKGGDLCESDK